MDLASFKRLFNLFGQEALLAAQQLQPREVDYLRHYQNLEKQYPSDIAQAALEIAILRLEAGDKFQHPQRMYFTREALEQASPFEVSKHRSGRFRDFEFLVDLGCSVGSDTLNLSYIAHTTGIDIDPLRLAMAQANTVALGASAQVDFLLADLNTCIPIKPTRDCALFFDPARRAGGRRAHSVHDYRPPLDIVSDWMPRFPALGVKLSPGVNKEEITTFDAELEFVSLRGDLKEAMLWFGPLKTEKRRATILPGPHSMANGELESKLSLKAPQSYLYEPDPAVLRAGLVSNLGDQLGAFQLDPDIAYLTAEKEVPNPFSRVWEVEDWFPFNVKRLREYLRARSVGKITVKKRGSPLQPEQLIQMLRLKGQNQRVVFLTHLQGAPITIVCLPPR